MNRAAVSLAALFLAAACGGGTSSAAEPSAAATRAPAVATLPPTSTVAATVAPTPVATTSAPASTATTPAATATPAATSAASPSAGGLSALAARGKVVFETAGEVGCQDCHGPAGKGGTLKNGQTAPDIRGATYQKVYDALRGGVPNMTFIKLTTAELEAVVEYLQYLNTLP